MEKINEIKEYIASLEADKQELSSQLSIIESILKRKKAELYILESEKKEISSKSETIIKEQTNKNNTDPKFPYFESIDKQIIYTFETYGKSERIPNFEKRYKTLSGNEVNLANAMRRMKRAGKLVAGRYNNINRLTFWGLPKWVIDKNGNKVYSQETQPNYNEIKGSYEAVEFI